jgi:hypothetical protein
MGVRASAVHFVGLVAAIHPTNLVKAASAKKRADVAIF